MSSELNEPKPTFSERIKDFCTDRYGLNGYGYTAVITSVMLFILFLIFSVCSLNVYTVYPKEVEIRTQADIQRYDAIGNNVIRVIDKIEVSKILCLDKPNE